MNHIADANKMVETPRTTDRVVFIDGNPWVNAQFARSLERELNAANDRIQSLIEERDRANRLAEWKWNLRDEFQLLLGTDKIEEGIEVVKELKRRIERLEQAGDAMADVLVWSSGTQYKRSPTASEWRKAKEAKP